jgi:cytochrome c oxidase subunit 1
MALTESRPLELTTGVDTTEDEPLGAFTRPRGTTGWRSWLTTVDHKKIGIMYGATAMTFFAIGGLEALIIRTQLIQPNGQVLSEEAYNQAFTMHGTTMVFLVIMPMLAAFANYLIPLMIGARDVAFPRMNALSYWVFLAGGLFIYSGVLLGEIADSGWTSYAPELRAHVLAGARHRLLEPRPADRRHRLPARRHQPDRHVPQHAGPGHDPHAHADLRVDVARRAVPAALRHPGHHRGAVPADVRPAVRRQLLQRRGRCRPAPVAAPVLDLRPPRGVHPHPPGVRDHLRGHPVFARKPLFGYPFMVFSGVAIGFMGWGVWAHHMFASASGPVSVAAFSLSTMFIAVPTGVKIFNWIGTLWRGTSSSRCRCSSPSASCRSSRSAGSRA